MLPELLILGAGQEKKEIIKSIKILGILWFVVGVGYIDVC